MNRPSSFNDPTGHREECGTKLLECRNNSYYAGYYTNRLSKEDHDKVKKLMDPKHYLEAIGVGVVTYAGLTSIVGSLRQGLSSSQLAAALNAGINVAADCLTTKFSGGKCTGENAAITATFSVGTGWLGGVAAEVIGTKTVGQSVGVFFTRTVIQMAGNTLQRTAKGNGTNSNQFAMDEASGAVAASIELGLEGNPYALSHIGTAVAAIMDAFGFFNRNPSMTLIPAKQ